MSKSPKKVGRPNKATKRPPKDLRIKSDGEMVSRLHEVYAEVRAAIESATAVSPPELPKFTPDQLREIRIGRAFESLDLLWADPFGDDILAPFFTPILFGDSSPMLERIVGDFFVTSLKTFPSSALEKIFQGVLALKRNIETNIISPHRNFFAYQAYLQFVIETGRDPSKPELKDYILARRETYKDAPSKDDPRGWTRLWVASGLSLLAGTRAPRKKSAPKNR
ncbi:MAG: hypothetical protein RLZZ398_1410 [Verrucomicrobiota bacterium]|jgi:hypothetical protein